MVRIENSREHCSEYIAQFVSNDGAVIKKSLNLLRFHNFHITDLRKWDGKVIQNSRNMATSTAHSCISLMTSIWKSHDKMT